MLGALKEKLNNYNLMDLLIHNSACQIMPENANKLMRFESFAYCACCNTYNERNPNIARSNLRKIYNSDQFKDLKGISVYEDPFEQMFTESITFYEGTYIVFPGITECASLIIRTLLKAIFQTERVEDFETFYREAYQTTMFLLTISDLIAKKADLTYGQKSKDKGHDIEFPSLNQQKLYNAVTFSNQEIDEILKLKGISDTILKRFIIHLEDVDIKEFEPNNNKLHQFPFVELQDKIIVTLPCNLLATLRHSLINLSISYGFKDYLSEKFKNALWSNTLDCCDILEFERANKLLPTSNNDMFKEGVFAIDSDKFIYIQQHTDDFSDYNSKEVFGETIPLDNQVLEKRISEVVDNIKCTVPEVQELLVVLLLQSAGRGIYIGLENPPELLLTMSVNDFETVAYLEGGNSLSLYKFAKALNKINAFNVNFLDPYSVYRDNDKSFYFSDKGNPDQFYFHPGDCRYVVEEMNDKIARHGALLPQQRGVVEVASLHGDKKIPIFTPLKRVGKDVPLVVEGGFGSIWIKSSYRSTTSAQMVDMVAFWVWQFSELLSRYLKEINMEIMINLYPKENWDSRVLEPAIVEVRESDEINVEFTHHNIVINLHHKFSTKLVGSTNSGERELMSKILESIFKANEVLEFGNDIEESLDSIAPFGPKKKLLVFDNNNYSVLMEPGRFPPLRFLDSADENEILDNIGKYLIEEKNLNVGRIENPTEVIKDVVGYLFNEIKCLVSTIKNPETLLAILMEHYEGLLFKREEYKATITTNLHCFSNEEQMIKKLGEESNKFNQLSVCLRFLIEYVGTCPPTTGNRVFSMEAFDKLLALSAQLIQWANNSDLIFYRLSNLIVSLLPSNRLGIGNREGYEGASLKFLRDNSLETLNSATSYFEKQWKSNDKPIGDVDQDLVDAFKKEFRISIRDFSNFIGALIQEGRKSSNEVKRYLIDELKEILVKDYLFDIKMVEIAFDLLSLEKRNNFLKTPKGYRSEDVLPWKFNRELSYLRRPLIVWEERIYWTNRHLYSCGEHLIHLCLSGKLKARTNEMKRLISKYQNIHGEHFNNEVLKLFTKFGMLIVISQAKKFGKNRIMDENGDLGDIDVLIINPEKKCIYALECKDLTIAKNPYEVHHELNNLFYGTDKKSSILEKHSKRTQWIQDHIKDVLEHYQVTNIKGKWKVKSLIVLDEAMISPYLYTGSKKIRVISFNNLIKEVESGRFF